MVGEEQQGIGAICRPVYPTANPFLPVQTGALVGQKKQFPKVLRALLYGLIALQQLLLLVVIALGFFDMWIDFRRTRKVES